MRNGFNNEKYLEMQSKEILKRIDYYDSKLYLEFGGKLFDDFHASRVLPGFKPSSKIELIQKLKEKVEVIFCINANDIEKHRIRADFNITYDMDVLRLIDHLRNLQIDVNSVVITQFSGQNAAKTFRNKLERRSIKTYIHRFTKGYPTDVETIVSDEGYGANPYIETTKPLVIVTAPGASGGKLATCLSQLYHEYKRGVKAGYAKYETFPIWNLPLKHPVNIAYEASTADLKDVNMIDSFHLEAYNKTAVNYNRDLEVFPVLKNILIKITGDSIYKSPTDMGVNMAGFCIEDDDVVKEASRNEIIRRYYRSMCDYKKGILGDEVPNRIKILMNELNISIEEREIISAANKKSEQCGFPVVAIKLPGGQVVTGRDNNTLTAAASAVINAIKVLANISDQIHLLSPFVLEPMIKSKKDLFENNSNLLNLYDVLLGLNICELTNPTIGVALPKLSLLSGCDAHASHFISQSDENMLRSLNINFTSEDKFYTDNLYFNL